MRSRCRMAQNLNKTPKNQYRSWIPCSSINCSSSLVDFSSSPRLGGSCSCFVSFGRSCSSFFTSFSSIALHILFTCHFNSRFLFCIITYFSISGNEFYTALLQFAKICPCFYPCLFPCFYPCFTLIFPVWNGLKRSKTVNFEIALVN